MIHILSEIGEGVALVLLKRLSDAEKDGDRIYCVIHDAMSNHDGRTGKNSYIVPSPIGQDRLLRRIYEKSKIDPKSVFYVECHGTGTQIGDPVETNTIGKFFGRSSHEPPLLIGSVKSIIGHTEGASGVSALIKGALCLYKGSVTPNMHFKRINPRIKMNEYNLHVVTNMTDIPSCETGSCFIGINSFGMGGNNCHAIISSYSSSLRQRCPKSNGTPSVNLERHATQAEISDASSREASRETGLDESKQYYALTFTGKGKNAVQCPILSTCQNIFSRSFIVYLLF